MTNELPPYDADAKCPKCGHDDVSTDFHIWTENYSSRDCDCDGVEADHMCRCCERCHYDWLEAPLSDTPKKPGGEDE